MKTALIVFVTLLLLLNGVGAVYGGWNLIAFPDGSSLHMAQDYLKYSPFQNYYIPGIILVIVNGVFSFVVFAAIMFSFKKYTWLIMAQGVILTGWIVIQIMMVRMVVYLHLVLGLTGVLLMICGWLLHKMERKPGVVRHFNYEVQNQ